MLFVGINGLGIEGGRRERERERIETETGPGKEKKVENKEGAREKERRSQGLEQMRGYFSH